MVLEDIVELVAEIFVVALAYSFEARRLLVVGTCYTSVLG